MTARALAFVLRSGLALALAGTAASNASALAFTLESHVGDDYTYTLTYGPNDNMRWDENGNVHASLLLSELQGVTAVSGPTGNDFPAGLVHDGQMKWTGSVLFGGTAVRFQMLDEGVGTGNYPTNKHVFGFTLTAPGTELVDTIEFDSFGFYNGHAPGEDRDVHTLIEGPGQRIVRDPPPGRVSEAPTMALAMMGLLALAPRVRSRRAGGS